MWCTIWIQCECKHTAVIWIWIKTNPQQLVEWINRSTLTVGLLGPRITPNLVSQLVRGGGGETRLRDRQDRNRNMATKQNTISGMMLFRELGGVTWKKQEWITGHWAVQRSASNVALHNVSDRWRCQPMAAHWRTSPHIFNQHLNTTHSGPICYNLWKHLCLLTDQIDIVLNMILTIK